MSSRVIKESILNHPVLTLVSEFGQDQFTRWILLSDDWGCFNADVDDIKGRAYSKRPKVTTKIVEQIRKELHDAGFLFCWIERGIVWGFWVWWESGEFAGVRSFGQDGERTRNRRKTPEPPNELLSHYLETHRQVWEHLGARGSGREQASSVPLFPSPSPAKAGVLSNARGEFERLGKYQHVLLKPDDIADLRTRLKEHFDELVTELDLYGETYPVKFSKYKSHAAVLETWYGRRMKENRNGQRESETQGRQRRTSEASRSLLAQLDEQDRRGVPAGD